MSDTAVVPRRVFHFEVHTLTHNVQKASPHSLPLWCVSMHWILIASFTSQLNGSICHYDSSLANQHSAFRHCVCLCVSVCVCVRQCVPLWTCAAAMPHNFALYATPIADLTTCVSGSAAISRKWKMFLPVTVHADIERGMWALIRFVYLQSLLNPFSFVWRRD